MLRTDHGVIAWTIAIVLFTLALGWLTGCGQAPWGCTENVQVIGDAYNQDKYAACPDARHKMSIESNESRESRDDASRSIIVTCRCMQPAKETP